MDNKNLSSHEAYLAEVAKQQQKAQKFFDELKPVANRIFSTVDGQRYARQMIKACRLLEADIKPISSEEIQRLQAWKDFVNLFVTKLVDRKVFIKIIEEI